MRQDTFIEKIMHSFNIKTFIYKILIIIGIIAVLALDTLVKNLDEFSRSGGGWLDLWVAIHSAYSAGIQRALGSIYPVIYDFLSGTMFYLSNNLYFTIGVAVAFFLLLLYLFFPLVALLVNFITPDDEMLMPFLLSLSITIVGIILLSMWVYNTGDVSIFGTSPSDLMNHATNTTTAITNTSTETTIRLI